MKYAGFSWLFIVYKILKGAKDNDDFKKIKSFSDFVYENDFFSKIISAYKLSKLIDICKLDVTFLFDEEKFMKVVDAEYLPDGNKVVYPSLDGKMVTYSCLDEQIERNITSKDSKILDVWDEKKEDLTEGVQYYRNYFNKIVSTARDEVKYEWLFDLVEDARKCENKALQNCFNAVLRCIRFDIYRKDNITKIEKFLKEYLNNFINDNLEIYEEKNFYSYSKNREHLLKILKDNYYKYGKSFFLNFFENTDEEFRYLDILLTLEIIENSISIKKLYFKDKGSSCYLSINDSFLTELGSKENKIKEIYIFQETYKTSLIIVGENGNKLIELNQLKKENGWVNNLYKVAVNHSCTFSKNMQAINNNLGFRLYCGGFFQKTKILKQNGMMMTPEINIRRVKNIEEFNIKRKKFSV